MMLDRIRKFEIKNSTITILAILLLAIHLIADLQSDKRLGTMVIYAVLLAFCISICIRKAGFYETVYNFIVVIVLGEILKNSISHLNNPDWIVNRLVQAVKSPEELSFKLLISTPYIYFYLIGLLLLLISNFEPNVCQSDKQKSVFKTLGMHSLWAAILHLCAVFLTKYDLIENVIFWVFIISAFWTANTKESFQSSSIKKSLLLVAEISVFILLYPKQYAACVKSLQNVQEMPWIYSIGLLLICIFCILSDGIIQDNIIGFIILGTNILFLCGMRNHVMVGQKTVVLFHIGAVSLFSFLKSVINYNNYYQVKLYVRVLLAFSYVTALMMTLFITKHYTKPIAILCAGLLYMFVYCENIDSIKGTLYGIAVYGAIPWILLETTLSSLGRMNSSLFTVVLFTLFFWCTCSTALFWKDSAHTKAIAFNKANSEMIVNGLSGVAYLFTALALFV